MGLGFGLGLRLGLGLGLGLVVLVGVLDREHVVLLAPQHEGGRRHGLDQLRVDLLLVAAALEVGTQRLPPAVLLGPDMGVGEQPVGGAPLEEVRGRVRVRVRVRVGVRVRVRVRVRGRGSR